MSKANQTRVRKRDVDALTKALARVDAVLSRIREHDDRVVACFIDGSFYLIDVDTEEEIEDRDGYSALDFRFKTFIDVKNHI